MYTGLFERGDTRLPFCFRAFVGLAPDRLYFGFRRCVRASLAQCVVVQKPGDQWSVLRDDGLPTATLRLPPQSRLEDIRGDEVVVVRRDSLDVQTVSIYRLKR